MGAHSERTVRVKFDGSNAGLIASTKGAEATLRAFSKKMEKHEQRITRGAVAWAKFAATITAGVGAVHGAAVAVGALAATAPALLIIPGVIAAIGVAAIAAKLGAEGASRAFDRLTPTLDDVKAQVSDTFERALNPAVDDLIGLMPKLTGGFQGVAEAMGDGAHQFTQWLAAPATVDDLNGLMSATKRIIGNVSKALAPLGQAFLDIALVGSQVFGDLTTGIGGAAQKFADFIRAARESGKLRQWMEGGIAAIKQIGQVLALLWSIASGIFTGLAQGASGFSTGLGGVLAALTSVNAYIQSPQGQEVLNGLGASIASVASNVRTLLITAIQTLAPLLPPLLAAFAAITGQWSLILIPLLQAIAPLLIDLATWIANNSTAVTILTGALAIGLVTMKAIKVATTLYRIATAGLTAGQWLLNAAVSANPLGIMLGVILAITAAVIALIAYYDDLKAAFHEAADQAQKSKDSVKDSPTATAFMNQSLYGGMMADGGRVTAGTTYMVGEEGPELFTAHNSGRIIPNHELGGGGGNPVEVRVFLGTRELSDLVRVEVSEVNRGIRRRALAGTGGNR